MIKTVTGDLLAAKEQYIAHQCNCVTNSAAGLAYYLFKKYPYANVYDFRTTHSTPGTIQVCGNGEDQRYVINMFSQYYPGGAWDDFENDHYELRKEYFAACLEKIGQLTNISSIAFPHRIGCGIAGGNWEEYVQMLNEFANRYSHVEVVIYQREGDL
jgi:O-acetyl-ADP-ribose deacetylase (regulator of RNase III)